MRILVKGLEIVILLEFFECPSTESLVCLGFWMTAIPEKVLLRIRTFVGVTDARDARSIVS